METANNILPEVIKPPLIALIAGDSDFSDPPDDEKKEAQRRKEEYYKGEYIPGACQVQCVLMEASGQTAVAIVEKEGNEVLTTEEEDEVILTLWESLSVSAEGLLLVEKEHDTEYFRQIECKEAPFDAEALVALYQSSLTARELETIIAPYTLLSLQEALEHTMRQENNRIHVISLSMNK